MQSDDERMMRMATRTVAAGKFLVRKAYRAAACSGRLMVQVVVGLAIGGSAALVFRYFASQG